MSASADAMGTLFLVRQFALLLGFTLGMVFAPAALAAGGAGSIDGTLIDKTENALLQPGAKVYLYVTLGDQAPAQQSVTEADASGHFRFGELDVDGSAVYQLAVQYGGATYLSDRVTFRPNSTQSATTVDVYEPTGDDKLLSVDATNVVIGDPDERSHQLAVLELDTFINNSSRTFVPSTESRNGGPPSLLRFSLPSNAGDLQAGAGILPDDIIQVAGGFGALTQLLPGSSDIGFSFRSTYDTTAFTFTKSVVYPTKAFRVLAPVGHLRVSSPQLGSLGHQTIGGKTFDVLIASNLQPGSRVELQFSDLPGISPLAALGQPEVVKWLGAIPAAAVVVLMSWYFLDRRKTHAAAPIVELSEGLDKRRLELDRRDLLIALARLDDRYDAGEISAADYRDERETRKSELKELLRQIEALTS